MKIILKLLWYPSQIVQSGRIHPDRFAYSFGLNIHIHICLTRIYMYFKREIIYYSLSDMFIFLSQLHNDQNMSILLNIFSKLHMHALCGVWVHICVLWLYLYIICGKSCIWCICWSPLSLLKVKFHWHFCRKRSSSYHEKSYYILYI